mgnify:CR=1 FL=1
MTPFLCPVCGGILKDSGSGLRCGKGHSFDRARSGYVNLIPPNGKHAKVPGDNKLMVGARRDFLEKGYYAPFAQAVSGTAARYLAGRAEPVLLDAGCGEGYFQIRGGQVRPTLSGRPMRGGQRIPAATGGRKLRCGGQPVFTLLRGGVPEGA